MSFIVNVNNILEANIRDLNSREINSFEYEDLYSDIGNEKLKMATNSPYLFKIVPTSGTKKKLPTLSW